MMRLLASSLLLAALAGCARDATVYPSLGQRPVEKLGFAEPDAAPPPAAIADPALDGRIATLEAGLAKAARGFAADQATAERLAKAAGARAVGSDGWLDAQSALATLDARRADTAALLTDADDLASGRAAQLQPDDPALTAVRDRISGENTRETDVIARLQGMLPAG